MLKLADGVLAFSFYTLAVTVPSMKDAGRQRLAGYTWTGILVVAMGALTGIFRAKQPGCVAHAASHLTSHSYPFYLCVTHTLAVR